MLGLIVLAGLALTAVLWSALWVAVAVRSAREAHEARMREALANARAELIEHGEFGQLEAFRRKAPRANLWVLDDFESESEASRARLAAATADARARLAAIDARTAAELEAIRARPGLVVVDDLWTCRANERPPTPAAIEWVERRLAEQARFEDVST